MTTLQTHADVALNLYERHVKQALKLYEQPERLGHESPLAQPYFLGRALHNQPRPITVRARGDVLCAELRAAAARLWRGQMPTTRGEMLDAIIDVRRNPDDPRYAYVVLELRCFHDFIIPNRSADIWEQPHLLPGSKSQHYRDFDEAAKRLAAVLLDSLRPALRPERPRPPDVLIGYDAQVALVTDALAQGRSITLNGPGGIGKTSIGASAVARLDTHAAFWYTFHPGFNDGASSLLFSLGAFLHDQGASNLWQYLITTNGVVGDLNLAGGLLRQDLASLSEHRPILCFDDLEYLSTGNLGLLTTQHTQLLDLIEGLHGAAPLLLISQRPLSASNLHLELTGLRGADIARLWHAAGRDLSAEEAEHLHAYTGGNPRLLTLMLMLQRQEDDLPVSDGRDAVLSLVPAFQRLWRRLRPDERHALQRLSVYQSYAPEEVVEPATLDALTQLRLIERDGAGGVTLLPAMAPIVRDDLAPAARATLHRHAAIALLERGEYTTAAFHFAQGGQENQAVQIWFPQRRYALSRGEADIARRIFSTISRQRLGTTERKALDTIRAELRQLAGQYEEALRDLEQADWADESEAEARLWTLRGELQAALGYPDQALSSYDEGLQVTARLLSQLIALRQRRGILLQHRRDLTSSWQEVHRAEFELEVLRGLLREEEGDYDTALEAYCRARDLAEQLNDDSCRAQAERWLTKVYGRRKQIEEAQQHAAQAIAIYERMGDRVNLEKMRSNLSAMYVQGRHFAAALEVGAPAYAFFVAVRDPYFAAVTAANLAEASYELGDLDGAARYADEALDLGEPFAAPYARFTLGQIALAQPSLAAAATHFEAALHSAQANDDPFMAAYAQRALGQTALQAGDSAAAQERFVAALATFRRLAIPAEVADVEALIAGLADH